MSDEDNENPIPKTLKSGFKTVYDKDGKAHVVSHLNGHDLVQHLGWSLAPPIIIRQEAPPAGDAGKKAPKPAKGSSTGAAPPIALPPVEEMSREDLIAEAISHGIEKADKFGDADLRAAVTVERQE